MPESTTIKDLENAIRSLQEPFSEKAVEGDPTPQSDLHMAALMSMLKKNAEQTRPIKKNIHPTEYLYLAGPMAGLTYDEAGDWRLYVASRMPHYIKCLSPLRGKDFLAKHESITTGQYTFHPLATDKGLTRRDLFDVNRSRVVLMNLLGAKSVSIGTMIELGAIKFQTGKLVVVAMEPEGNLHDHPMVRESADYVVNTLDEAIDIVRIIV